MIRSVLLTLLVALTSTCFPQQITTLPGWTLIPNTEADIASAQQVSRQAKNINYQIKKPVVVAANGIDWFGSAIQTDIKKQHWTENIKGALNQTTAVQVYATEVKDSEQKRWFVLYMGYNFANKQLRLCRIVSSPDKDFFQTYSTEASKHFGRLYLQDSKGSEDKTAEATGTPTTTETTTATAQVKTNFIAPTMTDIHSMIMHLEYTAGMGGGIYPVYNAYMLFKNGSIYRHPSVALADLDVATSKARESKKWGTWKMNGSAISVYFPGDRPIDQHQTWEKKSYYNIRPAAKGEVLNGSFKSTAGGGNTALGGDVMVVVASTIAFNPQGKFSIAKTAGVSSSRDVWENTNANSSQAGTYTLDGYSITLNYYNCKKERSFFFFYPDSKDAFGIGHSIYTARTK